MNVIEFCLHSTFSVWFGWFLGKHRSSFRFLTLFPRSCFSVGVFEGQRPQIPSASSVYPHVWYCFCFDLEFCQRRERCRPPYAAETSTLEFQLVAKSGHALSDGSVVNFELHHASRCRAPNVATEPRSSRWLPVGLEFNAEQALEKPIRPRVWRKRWHQIFIGFSEILCKWRGATQELLDTSSRSSDGQSQQLLLWFPLKFYTIILCSSYVILRLIPRRYWLVSIEFVEHPDYRNVCKFSLVLLLCV